MIYTEEEKVTLLGKMLRKPEDANCEKIDSAMPELVLDLVAVQMMPEILRGMARKAAQSQTELGAHILNYATIVVCTLLARLSPSELAHLVAAKREEGVELGLCQPLKEVNRGS